VPVRRIALFFQDLLRPLENPKKQSDGGGRLNPSRFLFRLAFFELALGAGTLKHPLISYDGKSLSDHTRLL
jgi:hypothetical protein